MFHDNGKQARMGILEQEFNTQILPLLESHAWAHNIEKREPIGEYLLVKIEKNDIAKKFAILFSQSTDKAVYQRIENEADACLLHGISYEKDNFFSKDFTKPIDCMGSFLSILKDWNHEADNKNIEDLTPASNDLSIPKVVHLVAENASEQVWMMLKSLKSTEICKKFLNTRYPEQDENSINEKAEGISYLVQNACDYFDNAINQNFTQRLLNLYYGTLSFVEAEILATANKYTNLKTVESITKKGHGLYTLLSETEYNPDNLFVGILGKDHGLFSTFLENRGYDISMFPKQRKNIEDLPNNVCYSFNKILNRIPELSSLMRLVDEKYEPGFLGIIYDHDANREGNIFSSKPNGYQSKVSGTYVRLLDASNCSSLALVKKLKGPFEQFHYKGQEENSKQYMAFVKHDTSDKGKNFWHYINTHKSSFCYNSIIIPLEKLGDEWEVYAIMILYTLSIIVRYYPNLWRRMQYGEGDKYYPVFQQFAMIAHKILPQVFYEKITGQKLYVQQSGLF